MVHESEGYFMGKLRPYLGDKPFYKKLITIALPITLQNLITIGALFTVATIIIPSGIMLNLP